MYYKLDQRRFTRKLANDFEDGEVSVVYRPVWWVSREPIPAEIWIVRGDVRVIFDEDDGYNKIMGLFDTIEDAREFIFQEFGEVHPLTTEPQTEGGGLFKLESYGLGKHQYLPWYRTRDVLDSYNSYSMPDGVFPNMTDDDVENLYLDMEYFFNNSEYNYSLDESETKKYIREWSDKASK